jgi:hypothetical protein
MRKTVFLLIFLIIIKAAWGEEISQNKKPFKAALLSVIVPGGGQFYNESYWKFGGVSLLESGLIGLTVYHHQQSQKSYDAYKISQSADDYADYLNFYDKRQSDLFWLGTTVFLSALDAFVDAHLYNFDAEKKKIHLRFGKNAFILSYKF